MLDSLPVGDDSGLAKAMVVGVIADLGAEGVLGPRLKLGVVALRAEPLDRVELGRPEDVKAGGALADPDGAHKRGRALDVLADLPDEVALAAVGRRGRHGARLG